MADMGGKQIFIPALFVPDDKTETFPLKKNIYQAGPFFQKITNKQQIAGKHFSNIFSHDSKIFYTLLEKKYEDRN